MGMWVEVKGKGQSVWYVFGSWASPDDLWVKMFNKELKYVHDRSYLQRQPGLQPKMRAILLDWLLEVRKKRWRREMERCTVEPASEPSLCCR